MRITTILLLALLTCMSCGKDDDPEPEKTGNCLTAVVDGVAFTAQTTTGVFFTTIIDFEAGGEVESKQLTITGTIPSLTSGIRTINLTFACAELASDLDVQSTDEDCGIGMDYSETSITNPAGATVVVGTSGSINIESITDDRIRGTFTFSGMDQNSTTHNITEGFFDTAIVQ